MIFFCKSYLNPIFGIKVRHAKPKLVKFPCQIEVPQRQDERNMYKKLEPPSFFSGDKVVTELAKMQSQWSKHPNQSQCGPLWVICHQQVEKERLEISADIKGWQE